MVSMDRSQTAGTGSSESGFHWPSFALGLVLLLLVVAQGEENGLPGFVGMAGLILLITGLYSAATVRKSWLRLTTQGAALTVAAAGAATMLLALSLRLVGL